MGEWISLKERLPAERAWLGAGALFWWAIFAINLFGPQPELGRIAALYSGPMAGLLSYRFTHWMPMPDPPKEEE